MGLTRQDVPADADGSEEIRRFAERSSLAEGIYWCELFWEKGDVVWFSILLSSAAVALRAKDRNSSPSTSSGSE
jgi:hypothetical protein